VADYRQACRLYGFSFEERADQARAHADLARALSDLSRYKEAALECELSSALMSESPDPHFHTGLAYVWVQCKQYVNAEREYLKAIELCTRELTKEELLLGSDAATFWEESLAYAYNGFAYDLHAELGLNVKDGLRLVNKALKHTSDKESKGAYLDTRGWLFYQAGEYEKARSDLEMALSLTMGTLYEHLHLAQTYEHIAESKEDNTERGVWEAKARSQWRRVIELDSKGQWAETASRRLSV
jgi:tetratricopeptide (TPR) repeat protein